MAGFADVTRLALDTVSPGLDPAFQRSLFLRDLDRTRQSRTTQRSRADTEHRAAFDADLRARSIDAARRHQTLTKEERRYRPPPNQQQYLLDAILRDQAAAQYDREAPLIREQQARARLP